MTKISRQITLAVGLGAVLLLMAEGIHAGAPTEQLQGTADKVLVILQEMRAQPQDAKKDRIDKLRSLIHARFDFNEMARRSLGIHWRDLTPEQRNEFLEIFPKFLEDTYVDRVDSYNGEKVVYEHELLDRDFAEVRTKILTKNGDAYAVDYRLRLVNGEWKVYDLVVEGISVVSNYRSQFSRVISRSSYKDLIRAMKQKQIKVPAPTKR